MSDRITKEEVDALIDAKVSLPDVVLGAGAVLNLGRIAVLCASDVALATTFGSGAAYGAVALLSLFEAGFSFYAVYKTRDLPDHHMEKWTGLSVVNSVAKAATVGSVGFAAPVLLGCGPFGWAALGIASLCIYHIWGVAETEFSVQRKKHMEHCCSILGCGPNDPEPVVRRETRKLLARFHPDRSEENQRAFKEVAAAIIAYSRLRGWDDDAALKEGAEASWAVRAFAALYGLVVYTFTLRRLRETLCDRVTADELLYVRTVHCVDAASTAPPATEPIKGGQPDGTCALHDGSAKVYSVGFHVEYTSDVRFAMRSGVVRHNDNGMVVGFTPSFTEGTDPILEVFLVPQPPRDYAWAEQLCADGPWLVGLKRSNGGTLKRELAKNSAQKKRSKTVVMRCLRSVATRRQSNTAKPKSDTAHSSF